MYASSYPLRPGPTCGVTETTPPPYQNTANPYDADPGSPNSGLHGVIQTVVVPLNNPAASFELTPAGQLPINYPGDPDNQIDWTERGLTGLEPAARACHDIVVRVEGRLAAGACAAAEYKPEVGQEGKDVVWVPTPESMVQKMLDMEKVTSKDFLMDLGSGDGRTVIAAAKRGPRAAASSVTADSNTASERSTVPGQTSGPIRAVRRNTARRKPTPAASRVPENDRSPPIVAPSNVASAAK